MSQSSKEIKSNLSQILPVVEACHILGDEAVTRVVRAFLYFRTPNRSPTDEDISMIVKALFYDAGENDVPENIQTRWNRLTRRTSGMDKPSFLKFMVPSPAAPYNAPGGHLGLFDCWVHALSSSANNYANNGSAPLPPVVLLPDILIATAVCQEYRNVQTMARSESPTENFASRVDYATMMLAVFAYRVYDSYQKKGILLRDTLHRFLSDVHGEDSYKTTPARKLLDAIYAAPDSQNNGSRRFLPHLTPSQFANGIRKTARRKHHYLLDWIAILGEQMVPRTPLPVSITSYLETLASSHRSLETLCQNYGLANLYEIKRRFHSLVETNLVVKGDVMKDTQEEDNQKGSRKPRHVVSLHAFLNAVTPENDEMGHGGYLPKRLATNVFRIGACPMHDGEDSSSCFWALYDVIHFGCDAVRQPGDKVRGDITVELPLMRFVFKVFGSTQSKPLLDRKEIADMLLLLLEHQTFRSEADRPPYDEENFVANPPIMNDEDFEESMIDVRSAAALALLPSNFSKNEVPLHILVDFCLDSAGMDGDTLSFDGFCKWYFSKEASGLPLLQRRLGPFLVDLRLIASVLFGVPPTRASMEQALIDEIQRRHRSRYPPTDVARRGPRGTVWYILEDRWFKLWVAHVEKVAGNDEDIADGRDSIGADARNLGKINNTLLLADNGSLALQSDIRWKQDYDIVPPLAWSALQAWYDGGPPIYRSVVRYIPTNGAPSVHSRTPRVRTEYEIELYPFFVTVFMCDVTSRGEARPFQQYAPVSRVSPVGIFLVQLCKGLEIDPKLGRIWVMENHPNDADDGDVGEDWLLNLELNILEQKNRRNASTGESLLSGRITLLLEIKDPETGTWPRGVDGKSWTCRDKNRLGDLNAQPGDTGNGIVGLYNMGNTCYLNSSIQCLGHTPIFRDYFISKAYLNDINTTNPLGHKGLLAQVSAVLFNSMWKRFNQGQSMPSKRITAPGSYAPVSAPALTPKTFKDSLGKFNEHFAGNEQHDAQELLAFMLGGLSEDLNRIVDKPYIEAPDSDGRPDSELADIWWSNHLKREMSIIVAMFTGQYKSLLTCKSCKYESARFEPFSFLQLPLPEDDLISLSVVYYPIKKQAEILKYSVRVRHDGKLSDVLIALSRVLHADENGEQLDEIFDTQMNGDETDDEVNQELEEALECRAQNMVVVDMREGYIFKIAPTTWALPDLQNKDTGELPLLHIYELDPILDDESSQDEDSADKDDVENSQKVEENYEESNEGLSEDEHEEDPLAQSKMEGTEDDEENVDAVKFKSIDTNEHTLDGSQEREDDKKSGNKYSFLAIAQRKVDFSNLDVIHPFTHPVFGTPLLLRLHGLENMSGNELYDVVAERLQNKVPKPALRFLQNPEQNDVKAQNTAKDVEPGSRKRRERTNSEMVTVAAGRVPRYGFRLRITSREGRRCSLCPWYQCCIGCLVPDDAYPTIVSCGDSLAVDWHFAVDIATNGFGARLNQADQPIPQSPFRVKANTTISIKNHPSCNDDAKKKGYYGGTITLEDCLDAFAKEEKIPEAYCSKCQDFRVQTKRMSLWRLPPVVIIHLKRFQFTQHMRRKLRDLVVFPLEGLDLSRILAPDSAAATSRENLSDLASQTDGEDTAAGTEPAGGEAPSQNGAYLCDTEVYSDDEDPMSASNYSGRTGAMLYDLYAVVHHQGALSGGHYVASLKSNVDGQWRLFNDAQVYEIHSRDVVDSSAYILFYIRRDVQDARLQDFWDIRARAGQGLTEEEVESLMKGRSDRCVIS
eukprot:CAMPEP_0178897834 /NCGR_PEP_ID=MMETSP0786-20121207/1981_1 /TAXON_ID=186022 /ORGANISM="Thalassionema frauenfeldii, Strain CCMP 1798" /LENGTH=1757 /DNA_ID=CAMNT_0020568457 /DNA_START=61 /DNA_END=5334 /DNA_ORIENTATION=+